MVDHVLIDNLNLKAKDFTVKWMHMVRKAKQLKHYNTLSDKDLLDADSGVYPLLSNTLDRGLNRDTLGDFFVRLGKNRMSEGYPISEIIFALNLAERVVIEYIMTEFAPENPVKMYQSIGIISRISEFFLLGCFYLTKGFLEAVYTKMNVHDSVEEELLKKYFRDDFFFKDNDE